MTQAFDQNLDPTDKSHDGRNDSHMRNTAASQWGNVDNFRSAIHSMTGGDTTNGALPDFSIKHGGHCHGHGDGHGGEHADHNKGSDEQKVLAAEMAKIGKDVTNLSNDLDTLKTLLDKFKNADTTGSDSPTNNPTTGDLPPAGDVPSQNPTTSDQPPAADVPSQNPTTGDQPPAADVPNQNPNTGDQPPAADVPSQNPTTGDQPPVITPTTPPAGPNSEFSIDGGKLTVNGKTLAGIAVTGEYAQQVGAQTVADQIASQFPGINVVRLATSPEGGAFTNGQTLDGGETLDNINQTIAALNAKGIGVIIDNHGSDANTQNNVSQNGNEAAWFSQIAAAQANNNMVMFQPENEPTGSDADVAAEQQKAYNAIRSTENATPGSIQHVVAFDLVGGGYAGPQQNYASIYNAMSNYVIDAHSYASNNDNPIDAIQTEVAQTAGLTEADGSKVPVSIFETGNSIDGSNLDPKASELLKYVYPTYGAVAWLYDGAATGFGNGNGADHLTDSNGNLTSFGQEIQALISAS